MVYNSDVIVGIIPKVHPSYNLGRIDTFLNNIKNKIIDSIRVIYYDIEGNVYVASLFYDGKSILYVNDGSKIDVDIGKPFIEKIELLDIRKEVKNSLVTYYFKDKTGNELSLISYNLNKITTL